MGPELGAFRRTGRPLPILIATALAVLTLGPRVAIAAGSGTITFDLTSVQDFQTYYDAAETLAAGTPGLWNVVAGQLQAPLAPGGSAIDAISFGNGADGAFNDGASATGITVGAGTVQFNTNLKADYSFTSFTLSAPFTLTVTGTLPLTIRSLGPISIAGTVNLDGAAGTANTVAGTPTGGVGLAGASNGGDGGLPAVPGPVTAATTGEPFLGTAPGGGGIGANVSVSGTDQGGGGACSAIGGGGSNSTSGLAGGASAGNTAVCAGSTYADRALGFDVAFSGGGGGGGGGAYSLATNHKGGGGGAGGGAVRFTALGALTLAGTVTSRGGNGGANEDGTAPDCGGGGGGGSGGSIWLQSALTASGAGSVVHTGGTGGAPITNIGCAGVSEGGNGSQGSVRFDTASGTHTVATVNPATSIAQLTVVPPNTGTYYLVTKPLDFSDSVYEFDTPTETLGCGAPPANGTLTVTYQGSNDGVTFTRSATAAAIADLNEMPFIRARVEIISASSNPPCLTGLSIPYRQAFRTELNLEGGFYCGRTRNISGGDGTGSGNGGAADLAMILMIALTAVSLAKSRNFGSPFSV